MRAKTKKWFSPLFVLTLAIAGIFGVSAAVVDKQAEETPVVEKADAATATTVYCAISGSTLGTDTIKCNTNHKGDGDAWHQYSMTQYGLYNGNKLFKATFTDTYDGLGALQFQLYYSGGSYHTQDQVISGWTAVGNYNGKVHVYGGSGWSTLSLHTHSSSTYIYLKTGGKNSGWAADNAKISAWLWKSNFSQSSWAKAIWDDTEGMYKITLPADCYGFTLLRDSEYREGSSWGSGDGWNKLDVEFDSSSTKVVLPTTMAGSAGSWEVLPSSSIITYDRNLNDGGATVPQNKNRNVSVNAYKPGTNPLNTSRWNPSSYKYFKHWNTAYDDSDAVVEAEGEITTNASFTLYYIEDWCSFRYKVNGGTAIALNKTSSGGDGYKVSFSPDDNQPLPYHGVISFEIDRNDGLGFVALTDNVTFSGNYSAGTGVNLGTEDKIVFKVTSSDTLLCEVPGNNSQTILITSAVAGTSGTQYATRRDSDTQYTTTMPVYIQKGQYVRCQMNGYPQEETYLTADSPAKSYFEEESSGGIQSVRCKLTGVYTISHQAGSFSNWNDVKITKQSNAVCAEYLAELLNNILLPVCTGIEGGTQSLSNLQNVWYSNTSSATYNHFYGQPAAIITCFVNATPDTGGTQLQQAVARYDRIEQKYGKTALPNFLGRNEATYKAANNNFNPYSLLSDEDGVDASVILIIVASSISILSITALSVLMVKKKKVANK